MSSRNWERVCSYQVTEKGKAALLKVLEAYNPDTVIVLPSDYAWSSIQLHYSIVDVTVEFDFVKITVNSQSGEKKFGFDDIGFCLQYLNNELIAKRTKEELFIRKVWKMYGGSYEKTEDGGYLLSYCLDGGEVMLKAQAGVCTVHSTTPAVEDHVHFMLGMDDYLAVGYLEKYLTPASASQRVEPTALFSSSTL